MHEPGGTKRATSVNVQLPCLQKDLRSGSISRDIVILLSDMKHLIGKRASAGLLQAVAWRGAGPNVTPNLPTNIVDFGGFDSSTLYIYTHIYTHIHKLASIYIHILANATNEQTHIHTNKYGQSPY